MNKLVSTKFISSTVYVLLVLPLFYFNNSWINGIIFATLSTLAVFEIYKVAKLQFGTMDMVPIAVYAAFSVLVFLPGSVRYTGILLVAAAVLLYFFSHFHELPFQNFILGLFFAFIIPFLFSYVVKSSVLPHGQIYLILTFVGTWISDTTAQFSGKLFGKRKLAPYLSPNKTIEGAIGSLVFTGLSFGGIAYLIPMLFSGTQVHTAWMILLGVLISVAGQCGDLFASAIKRTYGVKDFSNLIPGHGGIFDRFDSFALVAPTVYYMVTLFQVIG